MWEGMDNEINISRVCDLVRAVVLRNDIRQAVEAAMARGDLPLVEMV